MKSRAFVLIAASAVLFLAAASQPSAQQRRSHPTSNPVRGESNPEPGRACFRSLDFSVNGAMALPLRPFPAVNKAKNSVNAHKEP